MHILLSAKGKNFFPHPFYSFHFFTPPPSFNICYVFLVLLARTVCYCMVGRGNLLFMLRRKKYFNYLNQINKYTTVASSDSMLRISENAATHLKQLSINLSDMTHITKQQHSGTAGTVECSTSPPVTLTVYELKVTATVILIRLYTSALNATVQYSYHQPY